MTFLGIRSGWLCFYVLLAGVALLPSMGSAYPIDGFDRTGIRRLAYATRVMVGQMPGAELPAGAMLETEAISLALADRPVDLKAPSLLSDSRFQEHISSLFPNRDQSYSVAVLDITAGRRIRLALHQAHRRFPVGSIGKLAVAAGLFAELKRLYPDDEAQRLRMLKQRIVEAG
ncbi:MAG TPA: hypothetical protein DHV36_24475, partial [Desulfobacteraceae bacterium]|nr:hypothetical protein [Desulfobacteraceae bacterium]